jgi:FkbM family methyltransferase
MVQTTHEYREAAALIDFALALQKYLPRGKGAVVRWIGNKLIEPKSRFMTTRHGAKLVLAPDSLDVYATMRLEQNAWDYHDFLLCYSAVLDGGTFYDIGANVGYFAIEMAKLTNDRVGVCAFEPQPALATAIEASIQLNGFRNIRLFNCLVGDKEQAACLFMAAASIHASAVDDSGRGSTHKVPNRMISLDGLMDGTVPAPDMIKLDVEGSEHLVLQGARQTLRNYKPHLFIEYMSEADPNFRVRREIESLLKNMGEYQLYGDPGQRVLKRECAFRYFRMSRDADWERVCAVFLRNVERPLRAADAFEP